MRKLLLAVLVLLLVDIAAAATIHGTIYNLDLEKQSDAVVSVNSTPKQAFVAKEGTYSFNLPAGSYDIKAVYGEDAAEETITIAQEGSYVLDLILFPSFEEEELIAESEEEIAAEDYFQKPVPLIVIVVIMAGIAVLIVYTISRYKKTLKKFSEEITGMEKDEADKIYEFISQHKRVTQREIRKHFPTSEAKISLILTELEHKGKIEKIKKGRGNVIILK